MVRSMMPGMLRSLFMVALTLAVSPAFAADAPLSRWVDVDGTVIHFYEQGRGQAGDPVLLMIHGWCGAADDFIRLLPALPEDLRLIAVDLPGCGRSGKPDAAYDPAYFQRFIGRFCATLGLTKIVLVGHSMGGQLAAHFAATCGDLVERLILIDPYGLKGEEGDGWAGLADSGGFVDFVFSLNNRLFIEWGIDGRVLYKPPQELVSALADSTARSILGPDGVRAISRVTRNVIGHDQVEGVLPDIAQPTLVIWGNRDQVLPLRWAHTFVSLLPNVVLETVEDAGHMPMLEKPGQTAGLIDRFIPRDRLRP
jgi:4,5:9,10-diseco-3-hydroxy-5,9,17-trioxoandrosta-1(10),2-diene-4-oate hydrolase